MSTRPLARYRRLTASLAGAALAASALVAGTVTATAAPPPDPSGWVRKAPPLSTPWTAQVSPSNALPEYPRPQLTRRDWQNLNGVWQFAGATSGEAPPVGRDLAERVLVPYPVESALSGIQRREDRMWYRRTFEVPKNWKIKQGQRLQMNFGAVDDDATVWVNGKQVAQHTGGYDAFSADVTDALTARGPQEVVVGVTDLTDRTWQPVGKQRTQSDNGIFYQGSSGIWRTVWMEPVAPAHVEALHTTPHVAATGGTSSLDVTADVPGAAAGQQVEAVAYDGRKVVGRVTGAAGTRLSLPVPGARLWSPDSPFLYDLRVRLLEGRGNKAADEVGSYFGMREVGTAKGADGKLRLTLNGKILFQMANLDQGFWPDGLYTAPTDAALRWDLEQDKKMGFNTVRKHIKVEPDRWYYDADRLGLMVWQDMPAMRTGGTPPPEAQVEFQRQLHEMVREHDSFPSIVMWVPLNEGWGEWDRTATGQIADSVKAQDPSRLVDAHSGVNCCNSHGDSGRGDVIDWHTYVGPATPTPSATRAAVDGEHGGFGLKVPGHMWFGDGFAYEMEPDSATLTRRYVENQRDVQRAAGRCGISGAVYTQLTDVEGELNGFFTYDRQVTKMDLAQVRAVNQAIIRSADGSGTGAPQPTPGTPGLEGVAFYPLDETGGTRADDVTSGNHDGTLVGGAAFGPGHTGNGVVLDGSTGFVDTGASLVDTTQDYSASAWVKLDKVDGAFQTVVSQDGPSNSAFFLQYSGADRQFAFSFVGIRALAGFTPTVGTWYHLTGVRDAAHGQLKLYVDGALATAQSACTAEAASTGHTVIGRGQYGGNQVDFLDGTVDQVHVFDRALTDAEVAALYRSGR